MWDALRTSAEKAGVMRALTQRAGAAWAGGRLWRAPGLAPYRRNPLIAVFRASRFAGVGAVGDWVYTPMILQDPIV